MNVLHIINGEHYAGAERVQDILALKLPEFGYQVGFVCLKDGVFEKNRKSTAPAFRVAMKSKFDWHALKEVESIARQGNYSLVHSHTPRSALIGRWVAGRMKLPFVHHVHSPAQRDTENAVRNWINGFVEDKLVLPRADHLIPVSESLRKYLLLRHISDSKITVIPNGVPVVRDVPAWRPPVAEWTVGMAALFRPRKGIEVLLQALKLLKGQGLSVRLRAIGSFETSGYEAEVKQLCSQLGLDAQVDWTGFTKDVHGELGKIQTFVLPSLFGEGMPMVVLEAMSMGIPIVASDVEGIPEVVTTDLGRVVAAGSAEALAHVIAEIVQGRLDSLSMAEAALRRHRDHFSDTAMAMALAKVYDSILVHP
jgi:phosphatidylinositol alpha-mannosyltransferase